MFLDYAKLEFDAYGRPETPALALQTLSGETLGTLSNVSNIKLNIKFSEPSEISFDIAKENDGVPTPLYDEVSGYKLIYTKRYGIYVILNPTVEADGLAETKRVKGYSLENVLETKRFFLEDGTFNFWNPGAPNDTIIGRFLETAPDWSAGYISPSLIGRYRTFDAYDDYLLSFLYNTAPEKYRCVFVFDPYKKTINAYDADEERPALPIYLHFDNLVQSLAVEELSDELVTAIRPYGADGLDIRAVNPTGTNWMYDLSYFIANGDIPQALADKWASWQRSVLNRQQYYKGLVCMKSSATAQLLSERAALTDLQGVLDDLTNQQSVTIQALAMETTSSGQQAQQAKLAEINRNMERRRSEIAAKQARIEEIQEQISGSSPSSYDSQIAAVNAELSLTSYFTTEEYRVLSKYFIEQDITEETFVATDVDTSISGEAYTISSGTVKVSGASITQIPLDGGRDMYAITGGSFALTGSLAISGDIIRGTLESGGKCVMSLYAGTISVGNKTAASGTITLSGTLQNLSSDVKETDSQGVVTMEGSRLQFSVASASLFLTANVSEYQTYAVQMELFDFAAGVLKDLATPTCEFRLDSANFIFASEFAPFRDKLELGKGVYLRLHDETSITPLIIEMELDFENRESFSLVFSNRFKRHDNVNTLKDMIETSYSSSRSFDASRYIYNQTVGQTARVSQFMNDSLDAAVNTIIGASNQSVVINGAGIQVGGDSKYKLRIVDSMIAMTDDDWQTARMAIGRFASPEIGEYWGVNTEVLGGKIVISNNLLIESQGDTGVVQFRVDTSGAWLNNATFVLQKDGGGKILLAPQYGIVAGNGSLFTTSGTTVSPSFIDGSGNVLTDSDGMPRNANFYLDSRNGNAYFRGTVKATAGSVGGWTLANDYLHSGSGSSYVALNASQSTNSLYAIWAGASSPGSAPFSVKRDGSLYARNGTFMGTLEAARVSGSLSASDGNSWIEGCGIRVGRNTSASNGYNFHVDTSGNVSIQGNLTLRSGAITWENLNSSVSSAITSAQNLASTALDEAIDASNSASSARQLARRIADGDFYGGTFINGQEIYSPTIYADEFVLMPQYTSSGGRWSGGYCMYGYYGSQLFQMLRVYYYGGNLAPTVCFASPCGAHASWDFGATTFYGNIDFGSANVTGITASFG